MKYQSKFSRSNRVNLRLESIYAALGELEIVLVHWRRILDVSNPDTEEAKSQKSFLVAFDRSADCVDSFLSDLQVVRNQLLETFLRPLRDAFPRQLPLEILVKIWDLSQPYLTYPVNWQDSKESRKFLLLLKTTVLAIFNSATKGF